GPSEFARLLARGPGDVAQVGLPGRGIGDGEATAGDLLGEDADEMVLRPRLQRGHVEGERLLQILGGVDLLRVALDDDAERGAVLGVDAVDLERHTGASADGIDLRALTGADDEGGVLDGVVDGEDLGPVVDDDGQPTDGCRLQALAAVLRIERKSRFRVHLQPPVRAAGAGRGNHTTFRQSVEAWAVRGKRVSTGGPERLVRPRRLQQLPTAAITGSCDHRRLRAVTGGSSAACSSVEESVP